MEEGEAALSATEPDDVADLPRPDDGATVAALNRAAKRLRALPPPAEDAEAAARFVEIFETSAEEYERALPRIRTASRRLERAMEAIDPDELPPAPEGSTAAGGIMEQVMSDPEYAAAFEELMAAYEDAAASVDEKEAERLTRELGLESCMSPAPDDEPADGVSTAEFDACADRGEPVSLRDLVRAARDHGISLEIDRNTCATPEAERVAGFDSDATNAPGSADETRRAREGHVLCDVADSGRGALEVTKYPTDSETYVDALNLHCSIYPSDAASEREQVQRVVRTMRALERAAR
jgi:hypothetical protein